MSETVASEQKQRNILQAIQELHETAGEWPTPGDVSARLNMPLRTLRYHTRILEAAGALSRPYGGRVLQLPRDKPTQAAS